MSEQPFDATAELTKLRTHQQYRRRKPYTLSRLNRYRAELVALRSAGASYRELGEWLKKTKRLKITHTSVMRYLKQLPEIQEEHHAEFSESRSPS